VFNPFARIVRARVLVAGIAALLVSPQIASSQTAPFEIYGILPLTGTYAFNGSAERTSLQIIEDTTNKGGGIGGRPIKFVILDDASNPFTTVQLTNDLIAKKVPAIIGSSSSAACAAQLPIVENNGPLTYCLSPSIRPKAGSYVFSACVFVNDLSAAMLRNFRLRGWKRIAVITSTDATGALFDQYYDKTVALPENKSIVTVAREHFGVTDVSVAAQLEKIRAANPQVIVTWTAGPPFGTLLRGIRDAGLDLPVASSNADMTYAQMTQYAQFLPKMLFFPNQAGVSAPVGTGAWRAAQVSYFNAFKAIGTRPDSASSQSWDPAMLILDGFRHAGLGATAAQLHDYIENLHGWTGIYGVYDFRDGSQRGLGGQSAALFQWDAGKNDFALASGPGGSTL
jgi:branched-chain amino acid transport system substrate-binding protein